MARDMKRALEKELCAPLSQDRDTPHKLEVATGLRPSHRPGHHPLCVHIKIVAECSNRVSALCDIDYR